MLEAMAQHRESVTDTTMDQDLRTVADLRVAIVSDAEPERNGVGAYYADLAAHLSRRLAVVEFLGPRCGTVPSGLNIPMPGDGTQRLWLPSIPGVRRRLTEIAPHVVIVPTPGPWGLLGASFAGKVGAAVVVGFHTHYEQLADMYWSRVYNAIPRSSLRLANRFLFERGSLVLANSQAMVDSARRFGARKVDLMGTPVARPFVDQPRKPLAEQVSRVLFAGRLAPEKNVETVVEAARRLPDLSFAIAGDGPMRPALEEQAKTLPNLSLLGWLSRTQLLEALDASCVLVLPSHVESLGTIALEALARGRNVLVSAHCGITEWPMLEQALFRIEDGETVADALARIAALPPDARADKARLGVEGAHRMNDWAIDGWLRVLAVQAGVPNLPDKPADAGVGTPDPSAAP